MALEAEGDLSGAMLALGRAIQLDPDDTRATTALERVRAASASAESLSAETRLVFENAMDSLVADDLLAARDGFQQVLQLDLDYSEAADMLQHTEELLRRREAGFLQQLRLLARTGDFAGAQVALAEAWKLHVSERELRDAEAFLAAERNRIESAEIAADAVVAKPTAAQAPLSTAPIPTPLSPERRREISELYRRGLAAIEAGRSEDAVRFWEMVWDADPGHEQVADGVGTLEIDRFQNHSVIRG